MDYARQFNVKILAGIILLTSAPMARFMNKNIAGVFVPQDLIDEMASAPKGQALAKGIEIAGRMIKRIHDEKCATAYTSWPSARRRKCRISWLPRD
jgi:methylenetetrahydrofolate reductase (NADPH)